MNAKDVFNVAQALTDSELNILYKMLKANKKITETKIKLTKRKTSSIPTVEELMEHILKKDNN